MSDRINKATGNIKWLGASFMVLGASLWWCPKHLRHNLSCVDALTVWIFVVLRLLLERQRSICVGRSPSFVPLFNINPESVYDGQQRSFEDFQFDLENVLTLSQLCGKSAEERIAAAVMLEIFAGSKNKTAAEVAAVVVTDATRNGQSVLYAVLAAITAGRARVIVREDNTKNGAWAWSRLRERFGRVIGATSFTELFQFQLFQYVWREWVNKVSKLPQGSLISQAIEQLTISGMARHGQPELEVHLRLRAPMAWQDIQTQVEKISPQSTSNNHHNRWTLALQRQIRSARAAEARLTREVSVGTKTKRARLVANEDTWTRCAVAETHRNKNSGRSKGAGNGTGKGSGKGKAKIKRRASETCMCCGKEGHKNADSKFRTAACSECGKIGHLRAVCRNTNTHEIDEDNDENRPQVTVEAVWCMSVQSTVEDDRYVHSEKLEESSEHRDAYALKALSRISRWIKHFGKVITNIETDQNFENVV